MRVNLTVFLNPLTLLLTLFYTLPVLAQFPSEKGGDGWTIELGLGAEREARFAGSDKYQSEPDPYINLAYRHGQTVWYSNITDYGFYYSINPRLIAGLSAGLELGRGEGDDPALIGLGAIDDTYEIRLDLAWRVSEGITAAARAMTAGADKDNVYFLAAIVDLPTPSVNLDVSLVGDISWGSQKHLQTEFGVSAEQSANTDYESYRPSAGLKSVGLGLSAKYWIDRHWFSFGELSYEKYDSAGSDSPITVKDYGYETGLGIGYRF